MIVGTAGHIDHGKTTLVQALTGIDTDRLPEEKARGMSIELGYAFLDVPGSDERIGFIDVPGHERFVPTMLAGATGIDFALVLVAADDGVMPQTREHVAVLALLGVSAGVVVLDEDRPGRPGAHRLGNGRGRAAARRHHARGGAGRGRVGAHRRRHRAAARASVRDRSTPGSGGVRRSACRARRRARGGGVPPRDRPGLHPRRGRHGRDRHGARRPGERRRRTRDHALATGASGQGAESACAEPAGRPRRCRPALRGGAGRHRPGRGRARAVAGGAVRRGRDRPARRDALALARGVAAASFGHGRAGASGHRRRLRHGRDPARRRRGRGRRRRAAARCLGAGAAGAAPADRRVARGPAGAARRIGQPHPRRRQRARPVRPRSLPAHPRRLGALAAWALPDATGRLAALVDASPTGISLSRWLRAEGRPAATRPPLPSGSLRVDDAGRDDWALGARHAAAIGIATVAALEAFHQRDPEILGPDAARLRRLVAPRLPDALWRGLLADLQRQARIAVRGAWVHLPAHGLRLSDADRRLAQKVVPLLATAGFEGSWARDLARATNEGEPLKRTTLARLAQRGELHQVVKDLYYPPPTVGRLAEHARSLAELEGGAVTAASFRDATGLGRKRAIQILEYFDRIGFLRRVGDAHRLRKDTALFFDEAERQ